jgi:hypothetical protein
LQYSREKKKIGASEGNKNAEKQIAQNEPIVSTAEGGVLLNQKSDKAKELNTNKELGIFAKVSHDTIAKVKKIEEKDPEEIKEQIQNKNIRM